MVNDISIIGTIIFIFVTIGVILPFVTDTFSEETINNDVDGLESEIGDSASGLGSTSIFDVVSSVAMMFFWTFGALPFWLDMFFVIIRIILILTIARNIWIGGGG